MGSFFSRDAQSIAEDASPAVQSSLHRNSEDDEMEAVVERPDQAPLFSKDVQSDAEDASSALHFSLHRNSEDGKMKAVVERPGRAPVEVELAPSPGLMADWLANPNIVSPPMGQIREACLQAVAFEDLASLLPVRTLKVPGHSLASIWHAALAYLSGLTGMQIRSPFEVYVDAEFDANDRRCREAIKTLVPSTFFDVNLALSPDRQLASAAVSYINSIRNPSQVDNEAMVDEFLGRFDISEATTTNVQRQLSVENQSEDLQMSTEPPPSSEAVVLSLEEQQRRREEQIRLRDEEQGTQDDIAWNTEGAVGDNPWVAGRMHYHEVNENSTAGMNNPRHSRLERGQALGPRRTRSNNDNQVVRGARVARAQPPRECFAERKKLHLKLNRSFTKEEVRYLSNQQLLEAAMEHVDDILAATQALQAELGGGDQPS